MKTLAQIRKQIKSDEGYKINVYYYKEERGYVVDFSYDHGFNEMTSGTDFEAERVYKTEALAIANAKKLANQLNANYDGYIPEFDEE